MKKIMLLLILFVTGCSIDYKATVYSNNKIKEQAKFIGKNELILKNNDSLELYLDSQIESYKNINLFSNYKFKKKIKENFSYVDASKTYRNLNQFKDFTLLNQLFENITIEQLNNKTIFRASKSLLNLDDSPDPTFFIEKINIKFRLHNEILESNADFFDISKNILEWNVDPNNVEEIYFELGLNKKYDIILIDLISDNKITVGLLSLLLFIILIISRKIYKNHIKSSI